MKKLAEILSGPETWCQGAHRRVGLNGVRYCLEGAVLTMEQNGDPAHALTRLVRVLGTDKIAVWNDDPSREWEEVASVVDAYDRDRLLNP